MELNPDNAPPLSLKSLSMHNPEHQKGFLDPNSFINMMEKRAQG